MTLAWLVPVPEPDLSDWRDGTWDSWDALARRTASLTTRAGTGRNFAELVVEARRLLLLGDASSLTTRLRERRFARAVATAWLDDDVLAHATMTPTLLRALADQRRVSRLTTVVLATLFCRHYDHLETWHDGLFAATRDVLESAVASQPVAGSGDVVESFRTYPSFLLDPAGPGRLADRLLEDGEDVASWFERHHMPEFLDTRLGRLARDAYYLSCIERADPEQDVHRFLERATGEVLIRHRTEATEEDRVYFGHLVLTALTAKSTLRPGIAWLEAVLTIGGDPRLSQTPQWRTWWSKVPATQVDRARTWMRGVDLRAFLDGVEAYARATDNDAMLRMLDRRKRLLIGLYEQDRVEDVRLVLGREIRTWVRRSARFDLLDVAQLQESGRQDTAVVYVDCGDFCLVEGSHNFKLHVYLGGPLDPLANRRVRRYEGAYLRDHLPWAHTEAGGPGSHVAVAHQGGEWIRRVLDFLRDEGIRVHERGLLSAADYADLVRRRATRAY